MTRSHYLTYLAQVKHLKLYSAKLRQLVLHCPVLKMPPFSHTKKRESDTASRKVVAIAGIAHDAAFNALKQNTGDWSGDAKNCQKQLRSRLSQLPAKDGVLHMNKPTLIMENGLICFSPTGGGNVRVRVRSGIMHKLPSVKNGGIRIRTFLRHFAPQIFGRGRYKNGGLTRKVIRRGRKWTRYARPMYGVQLWAQDLASSTTYLGWPVSKLRVDTWRNISSKTPFSPPFGLRVGVGYVTLNPSLNCPKDQQTHLYCSNVPIGNGWLGKPSLSFVTVTTQKK